ncbi:unnamed protein product, partial [Rotaria sp. Silwood1]
LKSEQLRTAPLLIFANKQDIKDAMSSAEISKQLCLTSIKDQAWHIQACCALTGEGLYQDDFKMTGRITLSVHNQNTDDIKYDL